LYKIEYYTEKGKCPVFEFIQEQPPKEQAKILREIDLLEEFGLALGMPHIRKMQGAEEIWELRIKHSTNNFRIFYFCFTKGTFVLLHAIRKATSKTPAKDLKLATRRMANYLKGSD